VPIYGAQRVLDAEACGDFPVPLKKAAFCFHAGGMSKDTRVIFLAYSYGDRLVVAQRQPFGGTARGTAGGPGLSNPQEVTT
jgi:hypothetical protein